MCIRIHLYAHAHLKRAYAYLGYAHAFKVPETMKEKLFGHKFM